MEFGIGVWVAFNLFVLAMLALDLGVFHRHTHEVSVKEAAIWSVVWISLSMIFNAVLYFWQGSEIALQFFTGYLIEKSLSVDNIFVFVLIFGAFAVPKAYQHRILFWGILGALVMRGALIFAGAALLDRFHWIIYVFGAFLVFTGIRMAFQSDHAISPEENKVIKFVQRFVPVATDYKGDRFFLRRAGKLIATPLFLVLVLVESTDLVFAVDSIPAIFAVTQNPFIVYTSNVFAILGLRCDVLPPCRGDGQVRLPQSRPCGSSDVCWCQDAGRRLRLPHSDAALAGCDHRYPGSLGHRLIDQDAQ